MAEIIRMPRLSDTMEEGNIVSWLKKEGEAVSVGDVLAEVETDKATMELESFFDGTLLYIGVKEGPVAVDGIIAIIGNKGDDVQKILAEAGGSAPAAKEAEKQESSTPAPSNGKAAASAPAPEKVEVAVEVSSAGDERLKASPLAKSMAKEAGVSIEMIPAGDHGRVTKKDVESYLKNPPAAAPTPSTAPLAKPIQTAPTVAYGDIPVTQMRKVIARRLGESKFSAPHFYVTIEVNMDNAIASRKAINEDASVRISFNDFVIKACSVALRKHPMINSSWMGDKIVVHEDINIGVAVAVPDGLLVPVVMHADRKPLSYINQEVKTLAGKAKDKKLQPQEMTGNTFTISNLGMFDVDEFTAIINPPDACILAVGSIVEKPIVKNGAIVVGNTMKLTLSCDHRVVDGASAAQFLQTLKAMLENPVRMLV